MTDTSEACALGLDLGKLDLNMKGLTERQVLQNIHGLCCSSLHIGLFNFSRKPIQLVAKAGAVVIAISVFYASNVIYQKIFHDQNPEGFTAVVTLIVMSTGINLLALGVVGEYVYRTFELAKNRPLYVVEKFIRNGLEELPE